MAYTLKDFAFATVMDVYGFVQEDNTDNIEAVEDALDDGENPPKYVPAVGESGEPGYVAATAGYDFVLDSLTISNITQEGPVKEARGGIHGKPIIRHKKTLRLEMEDVVARLETLEHFFGATIDGEKFTITDKFPKKLTLIGRTYVVDKETGGRVWMKLKFNNFLPDGVFEIGMEAEGDIGMIGIAGELFPNDCGEYFTATRIDGACATEKAD